MGDETEGAPVGNGGGNAIVSDLADEDLVINFCLQNKIAKPAIDELLKRGFTSLEALSLVEMADLDAPKIPKGQRRLILHIARALQPKTNAAVTPGGVSSTEGTADAGASAIETPMAGKSTETTDARRTQTTVTPELTDVTRTTPVLTAVPANISAQENGAHQQTVNNGDLYRHVNNLIQGQQSILSANVFNGSNSHPSQVSWNDPQIHLTTAAGKSTPSYLDICDFVQTSIEEEVVLGSQGDQQIIVKSGPKKPRIENLTLSQWSVANLAILYRLVGENKLQGPELMDYLSYTTKIYQLVQRFSLVSVMLYDHEYRKLQAGLKFRWGTDVQHLSNIHLQARDKPAAQGGQQKKVTPPFKSGKNVQVKQDICSNYNSQKGCSYVDCKFKHICIIPGCKQPHSALSHTSGK